MSAVEKFAVVNPQIHITQELITPDRAKEYLKLNNHNRAVSDRQVSYYAEQMTRGLWAFNGDPIRLTNDGILVDGQHRLLAIIQSGAPQRCVVVRGVEMSAFQTIDVGKKRGPSDMLSIVGFTNTNALAAGARLLLLYESGVYWDEKASRLDWQPSAAAIVDYVTNNPDVNDAAKMMMVQYGQVVRLASPSVAIFAYTLGARSDKNKTALFFDVLESGVSESAEDPRLLLREALINHRIQAKRPMGREECAALTIKALNAYFQGSVIKSLRYRTRGPKAERFPRFAPVKI